MQNLTGAQIRQTFIDFFKEKGHEFVPSASLVPGGDATLLFTNAGMVPFKDVFLGTDIRPYTRATNSQKCMRVAGKHNDLDEVGRDDTHHTFFEMLGNWSFGDYYKPEAISWAWELLTEVWEIPKDRLYTTVFKDEKGDIPTDEEAATLWQQQPGFVDGHLFYLGRKDNFWEMAETGPCGPSSEIHFDKGDAFGPITYLENGDIDLDGPRFIELWNLVFIQYNRIDENTLEPLPATHVDTGLGFERIVSVLQNKDSNYKTDLLAPAVEATRKMTGATLEQVYENYTPYRVIADHVRTASFLIADGVVPGNVGRNYICRMIIRRGARFGSKINLEAPFMAAVAEAIIATYGEAYPELTENKEAILSNLTREELRFQKTVEGGIAHLENLMQKAKSKGQSVLDGDATFDLYATYGLPLELTRDIAKEQNFDVDEKGFKNAMEAHRLASGAGKAMGVMGQNVEIYQELLNELIAQGKLTKDGVIADPYSKLISDGEILALVSEDESIDSASKGTPVNVIVPTTNFYVASGGQVADIGEIVGENWRIRIDDVQRPAAGVVIHIGEVTQGTPKIGDPCQIKVDAINRQNIIRNHTATHLLHAALHQVIGKEARQAGSLVAPDRLRFDFNHPEGLTQEQLNQIEKIVNEMIALNVPVTIAHKTLDEAKQEGAMALFGEKYGLDVRTIRIGQDTQLSYELCGGTHVTNTGEIGTFIILSEGSVAAGIRRIEAITGRASYQFISERMSVMRSMSEIFKTTPEKLNERAIALNEALSHSLKENKTLKAKLAEGSIKDSLQKIQEIAGIPVLAIHLPDIDMNTLREEASKFANEKKGIALLATTEDGESPKLVAMLPDELAKRGFHAGKLVNHIAQALGGRGGGKPTMAQAGAKDATNLDKALALVKEWVEEQTK